MTKKLRASLILAICLLGLMLSASASYRVTYDNWEITAKRNTTISNVNVTGTLTVQNESGGSITFVNCSIAHLVLARSETADAPVLRLGEGCRIEDMTLLGSVYVETLPEAQLKKVTVADACDVQLDGSAEDVFVASGSIVTLTGEVQNLSVSQSAQINLSGSAEVGSAVFEKGREGMPSVLKIEPYAAIHTLTASTDLVVNGTGSIDSVNAGENSSIDMAVTITRRDSAKSDVRAEGGAALNYARKELLPMVIDTIGSLQLKDSEEITLAAKDLFGFSLDADFSAVSANPAAVRVSVDGDQLTLTRVGTGYSLISVSADLTGYLPARTSFMVSEGIGMTPPASKADPNTAQLKLSLGNICNKTLAAGEELSVLGISCDDKDATIHAVSSDVNVARVSQVSGGSFTVTGINAGIAVVTVTASKPDDGVRYSPAVRKFVVSVDEAVPQRAQLSVSAPSKDLLTKVYDGTAMISIPAGKVSGIKNGDDVHVAAIAFYADKHAGTGKTVYVSYHLYGENADLYLAPQDDVLTSGVITARNATIQAAATTRSYEPGNVNVLLANVKLSGLVNGDRVSLNGKNAAAVMKNDRAGIDKPVEVSGYKLSGDDALNYRLTMPKNMTVTITPAVQSALCVTSAASHTYGTPYSASAEGGTGTGKLVFSMLPGGTGTAQINAGTGRVTVTKAGTLILQVTREADSNYQQISTEPFTLTVKKAEQAALSISSGSRVTYGNSYTATVSGGSGTGSVTFQIAAGGTGIASINSTTGELTVSKAGTILITATKAEDDNYLEKSSESFTVTADKAEQSLLEVTSAKDIDFDEPCTVTAAGGSGTGAVTFSAVSGGTGIAGIDSATGVLTVTKAGTIKLKAAKAEDENYLETLSPVFTLTVHKADQADLFFTSSDDMVFEEAYTATAAGGSGTGGLSYAVVSGGSGAAAINEDTGALTVTRAGTILIKVTRAGDDNWLQKVSEPFEITVHKAQQAPIAFTSGSTAVYGATYNAIAAGGSGTGDIVYAVEAGGTGEAAINASTGRLTITKAGTILLSATREADVNYLEKTSSLFTLTVEKAEQAALSISSGRSVNYGNSYTAAVSGGSGTGSITYEVVSGGTGSASINSTTGELSVTAGGTILLKAVKAADDNYLAKTSDVFTLTVNKLNQSALSISSGSSVMYGSSYTAETSGGSGTGAVTFALVPGGTGEATINSATGELTVTKAGTIKLKALKAEDDHYLEASSPTFTLTIHKADQADLFFTSSDDMVFEEAYTATAAGGSGTGGLSYAIVSGGTGAGTIAGNTGALTVTRAGTILIKVTRAGDDNWLQKVSEPFEITVHKAQQAPIVFTSGSSSVYGQAYTVKAAGGKGTGAITYSIVSGGTGIAIIHSTSGTLAVIKAGTIMVVATKAEDVNYQEKISSPFTLTVEKAEQTAMSISSGRSVNYGSSYTVSVSGGSGTGSITYEVVSGGTGSASINSTTGELSVTAGGTILLKAVKAADDNYLAKTSDVFTLTVNKMSQGTLRITSGSAMTYGDSYTATCSGGSGTGYITYSIAAGGTGQATIDSATGELSVTKAGTIQLAATKAEDSIYQAKTSEPFTLTVSKASQAAVSITNDTSAIIIGSSYTVTAAGGTGTGAMSFSVTGGTGTATVNSSTGELNVTKAGTIILVATKAADDIYDAQSSPAFTLTVNKGSQTLTLNPGTSSGGAGTAISLNPSAPGTGAISYTITGGSSSGSSVSGSGMVTLGTVGTVEISATIAEDSSYYAASDSITLTSTLVAPVITALPVSRSNSFDGNYRDQISFAPTVNNPSGSAYPVTLAFSITKTGDHGSIEYAGGDATTARVAVGDYSITCTATNSVGSDTKSSSISIPQTSTSSGDAANGITGHQVQLIFNGNGAAVTQYQWIAQTAWGHSGSDNWSIVGYTGINQSGSSVTLASGYASAGASDSRSIPEESGIKSIVFTYNIDSTHGSTCLSSDVSYIVWTSIPYNDN